VKKFILAVKLIRISLTVVNLLEFHQDGFFTESLAEWSFWILFIIF